ncbi:CIC11C00000002597 [Sungouiella intermedia]|uniref:Pre-mRNA-splicing factor SYF2 n=1 Tax=Sungouiella intermedia TaxID=45354 RepID=A0A1L0BZC3_9ASCO|nr:CIC11C00000002597 [[Candida] intermedia]
METERSKQPTEITNRADRLKRLSEKRRKCLEANAAERAAEVTRQRIRSQDYRNQSKSTNGEELSSDNVEEKEQDRLNWTARQWEVYEKSKLRGKKQGFKGHFDLAHATYVKEISQKLVDKDKYKRSMEGSQLLLNIHLEQADIDALANSLAAASERRLKRRKTQESGGDFITEKNRQFNMKLDREYGKE